MAVAPAHGGERRSQSHYRRCCGTTRCLGADRSFRRCRAAAARRRRRPTPPRNWWQACGRGCEMAPPACTAGRARRARRALERSYYIGSCASTWLEFFGSVEWLSGAWQRVVECFNACQRRRRKTLLTSGTGCPGPSRGSVFVHSMVQYGSLLPPLSAARMPFASTSVK